MTKGKVTAIISNLISIEVDGPVSQNEICYVSCGEARLMAEVIKIAGTSASAQVFESTRGVKLGNSVEFTGSMLEIELGPGLLGKNFDGLQNDLDKLQGVFLERGKYNNLAENKEARYDFTPIAKVGDEVQAGDWIGAIKEGWIDHKIMVPFKFEGKGTVESVVSAGSYGLSDVLAIIKSHNGDKTEVTMVQTWPVKLAIKSFREKPRPFKLLETGVRTIDTFNPITEGGTGFIPGPFGAGKTVLQHALATNANADLIIMTACGERANEVVEIFTEFPELIDPRTGRSLMERTTIICNTSNMPVAAREASVYVGMTVAEYYRSMGLKVLLLADSTSRWAQALREMSNRLEELPGQDAFPIDLPAIISSFYARAGFVYLNNGETGSITFIGTVSPAGGNLKEPVTESTRKAARCFYALSQKRADSKRYPAVDPLDSYSKYIEYPEFVEFADSNIEKGWSDKVIKAKDIARKGQEASDQISILGDDAVPLDYHQRLWKAELIDFVILQQDAFDKVDKNCPIDRQKELLNQVMKVVEADYRFDDYSEVGTYFRRLINAFKQMNYSVYQSDEHKKYTAEMESIFAERSIAHA